MHLNGVWQSRANPQAHIDLKSAQKEEDKFLLVEEQLPNSEAHQNGCCIRNKSNDINTHSLFKERHNLHI